jgi:TonB family protein
MDPLSSRRRGVPRKVWAFAFVGAGLFHLGLFLLWPTRDIEPLEARAVVWPLTVSVGTAEVVSVSRQQDPPEPAVSDSTWIPPRPWNEAALQRILAREWPRELWRWGEGGQATVRLTIPPTGRPVQIQLVEATGSSALDQAFLALARALRFSPAQLQGQLRQVEAEISLFVTPPAVGLEPNR